MVVWNPPIQQTRIRNAVVVSVSGGTATVRMDGTRDISNVPVYGTASAGQGVLVLEQGGSLLVLGGAADSRWKSAPSLAAGWSAIGGYSIRYRRTSSGMVVVDGIVTKASATTTDERIFTLPVGYRPAQKQHWAGVASWGHAGLGVTTTGDVVIGTVHASVPWFSLSCTFFAEQ